MRQMFVINAGFSTLWVTFKIVTLNLASVLAILSERPVKPGGDLVHRPLSWKLVAGERERASGLPSG